MTGSTWTAVEEGSSEARVGGGSWTGGISVMEGTTTGVASASVVLEKKAESIPNQLRHSLERSKLGYIQQLN